MLKERFKEVENRLLSEIEQFYADRLISVALFGSVARETQGFDSDIDVLIIAKGLPHGRIRRIREFESVEKKVEPFLKSLRKERINTYISAIIKSPEEAEKGSPLFLDMVEDSKILFDRDNFFSGLIAQLRARLKALGAKRVWKGSAWYWILKPDIKAGEVFEV
ncbi:MAG: nucleotidyltransferase domain-containing protein [Candidatus Aenigmarchaeota archaeon]|nr:nucleotidyltransferase domain-containing protein [bacterium]NIO22103.1 nucleotidyltransferase domain-containing protein [Candidatus Aenigmarchaeota archaeon]